MFLTKIQDLGLFDAKLTTGKLLKIMSAENIDTGDLSYYNLDLEVSSCAQTITMLCSKSENISIKSKSDIFFRIVTIIDVIQ